MVVEVVEEHLAEDEAVVQEASRAERLSSLNLIVTTEFSSLVERKTRSSH